MLVSWWQRQHPTAPSPHSHAVLYTQGIRTGHIADLTTPLPSRGLPALFSRGNDSSLQSSVFVSDRERRQLRNLHTVLEPTRPGLQRELFTPRTAQTHLTLWTKTHRC
ncbi:hypothetical protein E2C01_067469 [Portunus trituberculatus]|uniref:Uncharacterized protein n=1 Tax=Portunus trituberculatus TaxID=210409 RepID=A0A5B7HJW2_PORTR|nr:hypothetical protein [Portunus trituberculatus]